MNQRNLKLFIKIGYATLFIYLLYVAIAVTNKQLFFLYYSITSGALVIISVLLLIISLSEKRKLLFFSSVLFIILFVFEIIARSISQSFNETIINYTIDIIFRILFAISVGIFGFGILDFIKFVQKRKNIHELAFENSSSIYIEYDKNKKTFLFQYSKSFLNTHHINQKVRNYSFEEIKSFTKVKDQDKLIQILQKNHIEDVAEINMKLPDLKGYVTFFFYANISDKHLMWIAFDVSDMDIMKKQLARTKDRLNEISLANRKVIENTNELIVILDINGNVIQASNKYCEIFGIDPKEISGVYVNDIGDRYQNNTDEWIKEVIEKRITISITKYKKNNKDLLISWKNVLLTDGYDKPRSIISMGEDITKITKLTSSLEYQANYNQITGLLNKNGLNKSINELKDIRSAACFYIDIDEFYTITDYYGIKIAEQLLNILGDELKSLILSDDILANQSESQFVLILINPSKVLIEKTKEILEGQIVKSYVIDDLYVQIKKRIGYALYKEDTKNFNDLINYAALASYHKPDTQYNQVTRYQPLMKANLEKNIILGNRLFDAIKDKKIDIHMQYIMNASTQKAIYVEALARWQDDILGFITPDEFFKVARKSNLLEMLETHLIQKSLVSYKILKEKDGHQDIKLTINLTPEMFLKEGFAEEIYKITIQNQVNPKDVFIEVSENTFVHNNYICNQMIKKFKSFGFYIAIDDFGSEYSSLAVLENIEYDMIKIDGSFINHLESKKNHAIVEMISRIGSLSHKIIVAEMVETKEVSDILLKVDIYLQQGYYFHKPQKLI
jgi:PAS domain S-box-containing protein/diguanylate cyclase (GGDEF)-like protein